MQDSVVEMSEAVPAIGIDLGTTYSSLGVYRFGKVEIIANGFGNRITPSMVAFDDGEFLSGEPARQQAQSNIENTLYDAKRLMGRKFDDPVVQKDLKNWPFKLIGDENNLPRFEITRQDGSKMEFSPEQISAMILTHLKQTAERFLGKTVVDVVITVPAYFNNLQRQATKDAAKIANLNVLRIVNEPTAAAIGYGLLNGKTGHHNVLVFDLGGGTFDVSILNYNQKHFVVVAVGGDTHLGGQDIDLCLVNHFVEEIKKKHQKDITTNKRAMMKLRQACELIKRTLSIQTLAKINIESLYDGVDFKSLISQALFDELNADLFNSTLKTVESTLKDAKMNKSEIEDILMVGGSTRIPKLQKMIKEFFGKEPIQSINPDEAVAYGACAVAAMLSGDSSAEILEKIFTDVTPLSLGIQLLNNVMRPLIPRNTQIPAIYSHVFVTTIDFQKTMNFIVFQGESEKANENLLLGNFKMTNIPAGLAKSQRAEVTFEIDANGILNVKAVLHSTQKEIGITIDTKGHLCKQEIEGMVEQAHQLLQDDAQRQELRQAKNDLEQFCWKIKKIFSDGSLVTSTVLESIMEKCNATLEWLDMTRSTDKEEFEKREEKLRAICAPHMPSEVLQID